MNLSRLSRYEIEIQNLDWYHKTGNSLPSFALGISTSVSRAVTRKSELWTHSLLQEHFLGQKAIPRKSQESIAAFGLREGALIGTQIQVHRWKGFVMQEFWLYILAPHVFTIQSSATWKISTFSDLPFSPLQFYPLHPLQGASLFFHQKPLDDIY